MRDRVVRLAGVALVLAVVVGGAATTTSASAQPTDTIAQTGINPDDVSMRITLRENGDAAWAIDYRVRLDTNETTDAFLSLREDIRTNESRYASQFRDRMASTAASAENATGREMAIRNVSVSATRQQLPQDYGIVTYTFVWTNFAAVDGGELRAGDALGGLFLDSETSLQFAWPEGYGLETVRPEPSDLREESRIVVWSGPLDFGPDEPTLAVSEAAAGGTQTPDGGTTTTAPPRDPGGLGPIVWGAVGLLVVAVAAGGWVLYRRRGPSGFPDGVGAGATDSTGDSGGAGTNAGADTSSPTAAADTGPDADDDAGAAADTTAAPDEASSAESDVSASQSPDAGGDDAAEAAAQEPPWEDELLSNEERVLALVEHEGGRMKQQEVAQTLDWTDAKTSQVVRKMRDEGDLDAFRLGRENVLVLPDEDIGPGPEGDE
ncbi:helix-turn-helix transcriptional regulator [Halobellus rubicundus]|uniref:MarR family transcriptional regulator n=1 Tax=Halobellus rubicundus TaxID=2996466 RepID=A0ABD5MDW8_9EURY